MKVAARTFAKNYLAGIREEAISELASGGVIVPPKVRHIEQEVVPWLMEKIIDFLHEDKAVIKDSEDMVESGFTDSMKMHKNVIKQKYLSIEQAK